MKSLQKLKLYHPKIRDLLLNNKIEVSYLDFFILFFCLYTTIGSLFLMLGKYTVPISAISSALVLLILLVVGFIHIQRSALRFDNSHLILFFICLIAFFLRVPTFYYLPGGQDEGVYITMSKYYRENGSTIFNDSIFQTLPENLKKLYKKNNIDLQIYPGTYIADANTGKRYFQFYPGHPINMALYGYYLGDGYETTSLLVFSLLSIILIFKIGSEVLRSQRAGLIGAALLAIHPLHVFFTRFPTTEVVLLFFILSFCWYFYKLVSTKRLFWGLLAILSWSAIAFTHIATFFYLIPVIILIELVIYEQKMNWRILGILLTSLLAVHLLTIYYGTHYTNAYFHYIVDEITSPLMIFNINFLTLLNNHGFVNVFAFIYGSLLTVFVLFHTHVWDTLKKHAGSLFKNKLTIISLVILIILSVFSLFQVYKISFTDHYIRDAWISLRWQAVNNGFDSVVRTTPVVILMYSAPLIIYFFVFIYEIVKKSPKMSTYTFVLVLILSYFYVIRGLVTKVVPYHYYYARYLLPELTILLTFASMLLFSRKLPKGLIIGMFMLGFSYYGIVSLKATDHYEMRNKTEVIQHLGSVIHKSDIVLVLPNRDSFMIGQLMMPLRYYYSFNTIYIEPADLPLYLEQLKHNNLYIISNQDIGSLGQEVIYSNNILTEQLASKKFIPVNTSINEHKHSLLLLKYSPRYQTFSTNVVIYPKDYIYTGIYGDNWSGNEINIFDINTKLGKKNKIEVKVKNTMTNPETISAMINDLPVTLYREHTGNYSGVFEFTTTEVIKNLNLTVETGQPCVIAGTADCRDLGILVDNIQIESLN